MKKIFPLIFLFMGLALLPAAIRKVNDKTYRESRKLETMGDSAFQQYEIEKACRYWEEAITENPDSPKAYNKLGICLLLLKQHEKAVNIFQGGLKLNSNSPGLNYNLALAHYYSGDFKEALRSLEKVLSLNSYYPEANYLKGLCLEKMGKTEDAQKAYIEELNNNPGSRSAWKKVKERKGSADVEK